MHSPDQVKGINELSIKEAHKVPLIVILGPTAVGKTELSVQLAESLNGEIISADSRLFYRGMDIGTAKPTPQDLERVPHHLINVADPDEIWTLARFKEEAKDAIYDVRSRGKLPFLVGGTGQYIRAVIEAWDIPEVSPDNSLRSALLNWSKELTPKGLHDRLKVIDPWAADRIDYRNVRRTIRALEVIFRTGRLFSAQRVQTVSPYNILRVGLNRPREEIYCRLDLRLDTMFDDGFVEEVKLLLDKGYSADLPSLSAIGYREIINYLHGEITLEDAIAQIKRKTRVFVRRQSNWFKLNDPDIHWFEVVPITKQEIQALIREWIKTESDRI